MPGYPLAQSSQLRLFFHRILIRGTVNVRIMPREKWTENVNTCEEETATRKYEKRKPPYPSL
jgi:hypothetical protein